jgi:hypothetical protein
VSVAALTFSGAVSTNHLQLRWVAAASQRFAVQWATNLPPVWQTFPGIVTSTDGKFIFTDEMSPPSAPGGARFYRLKLLP